MITAWFGSDLSVPMLSMIKSMPLKFKIMNVRPIKSKRDYKQALDRLEVIFDAKPGKKKAMNLKSLAFLLKNMRTTIILLIIQIQLKQSSSEWNN